MLWWAFKHELKAFKDLRGPVDFFFFFSSTSYVVISLETDTMAICGILPGNWLEFSHRVKAGSGLLA